MITPLRLEHHLYLHVSNRHKIGEDQSQSVPPVRQTSLVLLPTNLHGALTIGHVGDAERNSVERPWQ